ncbi:hypothetical protein Lepto7376_2380 [[Leptolyngbya] sp. PCC 7376]|uniref:hypothetical protein n=1 Tax=[Leptolyngbya] sp. PCC 7376 TaxID=111781 RepID=UPI00029F080B|nr:hypothetical protein [[Leptolyngbya] sp. PCC 7376]AFY38662.1 hypothetical protein Lepto7376_2380 [[Leptolyngbya] sp. PCC 7376]
MTIQNIASVLFPAITFTYDDVDGNITGVTLDTTHASITQSWTGLGNLAHNDESVLVALIRELFSQFKNKLTNLDCPVFSDENAEFFDAQGFTERDSGTTDNDGNPITELQKFLKLSFVLFFKYDPATEFNSSSAVNDND